MAEQKKAYKYSIESDSILLSRQRELERHPPHLEDDQRLFLCFSTGGYPFALKVNEAAQVKVLKDIVPVPFQPDFFIGIVPMNGELVSVIDLAVMIMGGETNARKNTHSILLRRDDASLCIVTESNPWICSFHSSEICDSVSFGQEWIRDICEHIYAHQDKHVGVLSIEAIFHHERLRRLL